jgi:hypothetical protein
MRYSVEKFTCEKDAPMFAGQTFFRLYDNQKFQYELAMYSSQSIADEVANWKNNI